MAKRSLLKYRLEKFDKALLFQVLEMDEEQIRPAKSRSTPYVFSQAGVDVKSMNSPEILASSVMNDTKSFRIYLSGSDLSKNLRPNLSYFNDNESRDFVYNRIIAALEAWAKNGGFDEVKKLVKQKPSARKAVEENIFEVFSPN